MKVGIVLFPGSNCAEDSKVYFGNKNNQCFYIWHKDDDITKYDMDLLIIPGGFAFGDRDYQNATDNKYDINPGKMAIESPVSEIILEAHKKEIPILGICNGFQILTKMGLLPGKLLLNNNQKFTCETIVCKIKSNIIPELKDNIINIDVANSYGKYDIDQNQLKPLIDNDQILLKYVSGDYKTKNGSMNNIAGVCDKSHLVFGMMPHPERNSDDDTIYQIISKIVNQNMMSRSIKNLMFSEHISYKSTKKYLKKLYTDGSHVIQGPGENAGIVHLDGDYCLAIRIESHNHPTFIDPFNGASTGVGGILRDIFTMGARPIGILDFLRFGVDENSDNLLKETVKGIADYGNCFGVANLGGDCYKSDIYNTNPIVNVACLGLMKKSNIVYGNALSEGEVLIYVGAKTGNEGVNGAAMASDTFKSGQNLSSLKKNIQIGDAFLEKLLLESCLEIINSGLVVGMQDMGAGGVLCSTLEVILRGRDKTNKNLGCDIFVDMIPSKYEMDKSHKLISESQERMLLVVKKENTSEVFDIFEKWNLESAIIGEVNNSGIYKVIGQNESHIYSKPIQDFDSIQEDWDLNDFTPRRTEFSEIKNPELWNTYDSTIGLRSSEIHRGSNNHSIIDIYEINKKLIISWGSDFEICYNTIKNKNFKPLGLVNCLNYGHPNDSMGSMVEFLDKLNDSCKKNEVPVLGGNVSLYNATDNVSINPTPILVMIGIN